MTDRELLEQAAKAAGYGEKPNHFYRSSNGDWFLNGNEWNPLTDDGDALRLAVKLGIKEGFGFAIAGASVVAATSGGVAQEENIDIGINPYAATRRAIVRAAAEIGKELP